MTMYKVVFTDHSGYTDQSITEYETGDSPQEALEIALGRHGLSVQVTEMEAEND